MFALLAEFKYAAEIVAWLTGDGLLVLICLAVGYYVKEWRALALSIAAGLLLSGYFLTKGVYLGHALERASLEVREKQVEQQGDAARASAEHDVAADVATGRVFPDRYDRAQRNNR